MTGIEAFHIKEIKKHGGYDWKKYHIVHCSVCDIPLIQEIAATKERKYPPRCGACGIKNL